MAKLPTSRDFLLPEGSHAFQIYKEPYFKKLKDLYDGIVFPLREMSTNKEYEKFFFLNSLNEFLAAIGVSIDEDGNFDDSDAVGKLFKCDIKHETNAKGNKMDVITNIEASAWDA